MSQGEAAWADYESSAQAWAHLATRNGLAACVRGQRRCVALALDADRHIRLIRQHDGLRRVLAASDVVWDVEQTLDLSLKVSASTITARVGEAVLTASDDGLPLSGAVGLLEEERYAEFGAVRVRPAV